MEIRNGLVYAADMHKIRLKPDGNWCNIHPLLSHTIDDFEEILASEIGNIPPNPVVLREQYEQAVLDKIRVRYSASEEEAIKTKAMSAMYTYLSSGDMLAIEKADAEAFREFKCFVVQCKEEAHMEIYNEPHP